MMRQPNGRPGVLVAEHERPVRAVLQQGLTRHGFDVWLAGDGSEALDRDREHRGEISVVLLDDSMPGLVGPHALDALCGLSPDIRACFRSGDTGVYKVEELLRRGGACVIAKPFRLEAVAGILRLVARGALADWLPSARPQESVSA